MAIDPVDRPAALERARQETRIHLVCLAQIAARIEGDAMIAIAARQGEMRAIGRRLVLAAGGEFVAEGE